MRLSLFVLPTLFSLLVMASAVWAGDAVQYQVDKMRFKVVYVEHGEKISRISADADESNNVGITDDLWIKTSDMLQASVSVVDAQGESVSIEQAMLRLVNLRTGVDNLYVMRKIGTDAKVEVNLKREIRSDREFWAYGDGADSEGWRVELIVGDTALKNSRTWTVAKRMRIEDKDADVLKEAKRGVFDFDVSVKRNELPEFEFPIPKGEKRAKVAVVFVALFAVVFPLPVLLFVWMRMGVLPLRLPRNGKQLMVVTGLQACLIAHIFALAMFWVRWNIVTTWKVMGAIMIPTMILMRLFVNGDECEPE